MTTILLILLGVVFAIITWRDFRFALAALFGFLPAYLLRFSIGPLPSTLLEVFILTLAATWVLRDRHAVVRAFQHLLPWRVPILLFLAAACIAAAHAPNSWSALGILKAYAIEPVLVFLMLRATFTERRDWERATIALTISGVLVAVLALVQYVTGVGIPAPWDLERRTTSVFDFPNAVGLFLAPIVAMTVFSSSSYGIRSVAIIVMCTAILTSETEAAIIAIPAAVLVTMLLSGVKRTTTLAAIGIAVALSAVAFGISGTVREKVLLQDVSGQARLAMWRETVAMLGDHPLLGAGLSGFPTAIAPYHDGTFFEIFQYPHTIILNIWVELGMLGLVATLLTAIFTVRAVWRHRSDPIVLAAFAALVTMTIHGLVDVPFFKNDLAVMTALFLARVATNTHGAQQPGRR